MVPSDDALVMVDSHDMQRGHTGTLGLNINFFEPKLLKVTVTHIHTHNFCLNCIQYLKWQPF